MSTINGASVLHANDSGTNLGFLRKVLTGASIIVEFKKSNNYLTQIVVDTIVEHIFKHKNYQIYIISSQRLNLTMILPNRKHKSGTTYINATM